jgi:hypothetical protein
MTHSLNVIKSTQFKCTVQWVLVNSYEIVQTLPKTKFKTFLSPQNGLVSPKKLASICCP